MKLEKSAKDKRDVIPFINEFSHLSAIDLDDIMEWLEDRGYMSDTGRRFKTAFWMLFIKRKL